MKKLKFESFDNVKSNLDIIAEHFPTAITERNDSGSIERGINFELLKQELSPYISDDEKYEFSWIGKKSAIEESKKTTCKTLRPIFADSKDWDNTQNLYLEGDNLDILRLLQKSYRSKIKMIYIDPPYNTGNSYIYKDDYALKINSYKSHYTNESILTKKSDLNERLHSGWCSMIYPRLKVARTLLRDDGVIFISIDDNELDNLKKICNEIFGENNFVTIIGIEITKTQGMKVKSAKNGSIVKNFEYVLCYAKKTTNKKIVKNILFDKNEGYDKHFSYYIRKKNGNIRIRKLVDVLVENKEIYSEFKKYNIMKNGKITMNSIGKGISVSDKIRKFIYFSNANYIYQEMACSIKLNPLVQKQLDHEKVVEYKDYLLTKTNGGKIRQFSPLSETLKYSDEYKREYGRVTIRGNLWKGFYSDMMNVAKEGEVEYKNGKKPVRLIYQLAKWIGVENGDIVMDFFSGSATTAHAVMKMNAEDLGHRKFIMVQIDENLDELMLASTSEKKKNIKKSIEFLNSVDRPHILSELGKERILRAGNEIIQKMKKHLKNYSGDNHPIDVGFRVFRLDSSNMVEQYYSNNNESGKKRIKRDKAINIKYRKLKEGRTKLDLLYSIILDLGLPLTVNHKIEEVYGTDIYSVTNDSNNYSTKLTVCFVENLSYEVIKEIFKRKPEYAVFNKMAFLHELSKSDVDEMLKKISPFTKLYLI